MLDAHTRVLEVEISIELSMPAAYRSLAFQQG
jgi:hypothetical protein